MVTVLPRHAAMLVMLDPGELIVRSGEDEEDYAVGGGFMEVADDQVTILGDTVERADEIDVLRAEAARQRARALVARYQDRPEHAAGMQALRRSRARLNVAQHARRRRVTRSR
jgi:F-type H+-transporting ATPase subunit epsilon